jgi:hypothetical protein
MYPNRKPKCQQRHHEPGDFDEGFETLPSGSKVKVTRFSDGSQITHFGGPCGPTYTDEFGRECGGPDSGGIGGQRS